MQPALPSRCKHSVMTLGSDEKQLNEKVARFCTICVAYPVYGNGNGHNPEPVLLAPKKGPLENTPENSEPLSSCPRCGSRLAVEIDEATARCLKCGNEKDRTHDRRKRRRSQPMMSIRRVDRLGG